MLAISVAPAAVCGPAGWALGVVACVSAGGQLSGAAGLRGQGLPWSGRLPSLVLGLAWRLRESASPRVGFPLSPGRSFALAFQSRGGASAASGDLRDERTRADAQAANLAVAVEAIQERMERALVGLGGATLLLVAAVGALVLRGGRSPAGRSAGERPPIPAPPGDELSELSQALGRVLQALRTREACLEALQALSVQVACHEAEPLCDRALGAVAERLGAKSGSIYLLAEGGRGLLRRASLASQQGAPSAREEAVADEAVRERASLIRSLAAEPPVPVPAEQVDPQAVLAIPLIAAEEPLGVLVLGGMGGLDAGAVSFAEAAAALLAVGLDAALGRARARELSRQLESQGEALRAQGQELAAGSEQLRRAHEVQRLGEAQNNRLLSLLARELKGLLAPARDGVEALARALPTGEQAPSALESVARQLAQLARLADDLLDLARIIQGQERLLRARHDVGHLLREAAEFCRPIFDRQQLALELRLPPQPCLAQVDPERLRRMATGLLLNAARNTQRGGWVAMSLAERRESGSLVLRVSDTGTGMAPSVMAAPFQPFAQADGAQASDGLGLTLAVVKGLVELHGGRISAASPGPGLGSSFTVELPVAAPEQAAEVPAPAGRRLLIIEDDRQVAESLRDSLELSGHSILLASNGLEGLEVLRHQELDGVLCDIGLPGIDGYEVAKAVRADRRLRDLYLVALTGYSSPEDQRRAIRAGFHAYIAKPPGIEEMQELLSHIPTRRTAEPDEQALAGAERG